MKMIAINDSPRSGWNTDILVRVAAAGAISAGADVEMIDLYKLDPYSGWPEPRQPCLSWRYQSRASSPLRETDFSVYLL